MRKTTTIELLLGTILGVMLGVCALRAMSDSPVSFTASARKAFEASSRGKRSNSTPPDAPATPRAESESEREFWSESPSFGEPVRPGRGRTITSYGVLRPAPEVRIWVPGAIVGICLFFAMRARCRRGARRLAIASRIAAAGTPLPPDRPIRTRPPGLFIGAVFGIGRRSGRTKDRTGDEAWGSDDAAPGLGA